MKLKTIALGTLLAMSAMGAQAVPGNLDTISGAVNIKMVGQTTENSATCAPGAFANTNLCETTWGVGTITQITKMTAPFTTLWNSGDNNQFLAFMIYGIADQGYTAGGTYGTNIFNTGATAAGQTAASQFSGADGKIHLDVYRAATDFTYTAAAANRIDFDEYTGISTHGTLWLSATMDAGLFAADDGATTWDETLTTLFQNATSSSLNASINGNGSFLASVGGAGTGNPQWDTNGIAAGSDLQGKFTLTYSGDPLFPGLINDPITGNKLPEPGSLALLGGALFGLAGLRRRKSYN